VAEMNGIEKLAQSRPMNNSDAGESGRADSAGYCSYFLDMENPSGTNSPVSQEPSSFAQ